MSDFKLNLFTASGDLSADYTSDAWKIPDGECVAITITMNGGSPVGTWKLQSNGDPTDLGASSTSWIDIAGASQAITAASDTVTFVLNMPFVAVRAKYTRTSGSSTAGIFGIKQSPNAMLTAKGF